MYLAYCANLRGGESMYFPGNLQLISDTLNWARQCQVSAGQLRDQLKPEQRVLFEHWNTQMDNFINEVQQDLEQSYYRGSLNNQLEYVTHRAYSLYQDLLKIGGWEDTDRCEHIEEETYFRNEAAQAAQASQVALQPVPIGSHRLPPLPYAYDALEPYISAEIMRLHHQKHHQSYVDGLNKAEQKMKEAREKNDFDLIKHWEREAAFHGSGHYLHTIFWQNMKPQGGGKPKGELLDAINQTFGSFEKFKKHFSKAAEKVEGVGWAILVWSPRSHRLEILQSEFHQHFTQWDIIPLLVLDIWEHAYYLQYKNEREKYIENWWNVVDWEHVASRYREAKKLRWQPF